MEMIDFKATDYTRDEMTLASIDDNTFMVCDATFKIGRYDAESDIAAVTLDGQPFCSVSRDMNGYMAFDGDTYRANDNAQVAIAQLACLLGAV